MGNLLDPLKQRKKERGIIVLNYVAGPPGGEAYYNM